MIFPEPDPHVSRRRAILVTVLALGFVARLTLGSAPVNPDASPVPFTCLLACQTESLRDVLSNILLFLPLGWALRHWLSATRAIGLCLLASVAIEALQVSVIVGRDSSLRDILSNVAGGALGAWLFDHWRRLLWPDPVTGARFAGLAALGWAGVLTASAYGNRLDPTGPPWYGLWTPELEQYDKYPGKLVAVDLAGWTPPNGPMIEPVPLREAMRRDSFRLRIGVVAGGLPERAAPIFSVTDDLRQDQFFVGQRRKSLWLHLRSRFDRWKLRGLTVRLPLIPDCPPGDTMTVEAGLQDRHIFVRAVTTGGQAEVWLPLTVGLGWTTLMPFHFPLSSEWLLMNPLWLAWLILPTGYWLGRARPGHGLALTAVTVTLGLLVVPLVAGAAGTSLVEWAGAGAGAVLGWAAGVRSRGVPVWLAPRNR